MSGNGGRVGRGQGRQRRRPWRPAAQQPCGLVTIARRDVLRMIAHGRHWHIVNIVRCGHTTSTALRRGPAAGGRRTHAQRMRTRSECARARKTLKTNAPASAAATRRATLLLRDVVRTAHGVAVMRHGPAQAGAARGWRSIAGKLVYVCACVRVWRMERMQSVRLDACRRLGPDTVYVVVCRSKIPDVWLRLEMIEGARSFMCFFEHASASLLEV